MASFRRPFHRAVAKLAASLNTDLLLEAQCFHGGGTQLALTHDEFRLSADLDFLCSKRDGYRRVREQVTETSLGQIFRSPIRLARSVNTANDGIRTAIDVDGQIVKFAILIEARLDLVGKVAPPLAIPTLAFEYAVAEKFLANADRGLDDATHQRDVVDLAVLAAHHGVASLRPGLELAKRAYGGAVERCLWLVVDSLQKPGRMPAVCSSLAIDDPAPLRKGLRVLPQLRDRSPRPCPAPRP